MYTLYDFKKSIFITLILVTLVNKKLFLQVSQKDVRGLESIYFNKKSVPRRPWVLGHYHALEFICLQTAFIGTPNQVQERTNEQFYQDFNKSNYVTLRYNVVLYHVLLLVSMKLLFLR